MSGKPHYRGRGGSLPKASYRPRPNHVAVPLDFKHEFLNETLLVGDPILKTWRQHFRATGVTFAEKERGGRVMLYTHRARALPDARGGSGWCCK